MVVLVVPKLQTWSTAACCSFAPEDQSSLREGSERRIEVRNTGASSLWSRQFCWYSVWWVLKQYAFDTRYLMRGAEWSWTEFANWGCCRGCRCSAVIGSFLLGLELVYCMYCRGIKVQARDDFVTVGSSTKCTGIMQFLAQRWKKFTKEKIDQICWYLSSN